MISVQQEQRQRKQQQVAHGSPHDSLQDTTTTGAIKMQTRNGQKHDHLCLLAPGGLTCGFLLAGNSP